MTSRVLQSLHLDPYENLLRDHTGERLRKALSPAYLRDKLALISYERRRPDHPWLTRDAIALLEGYLSPDHRGYEWGSGNGSIWFARRSGSLVSVEHNPRWYEIVRRQIEAQAIRNIDYRLVPEQSYTSVIDAFDDGRFDYVLVDGLFRDVAFLKSIPKVKPGGWIIFDNANWHLPSDSRTPHSRRSADGPSSELFGQVAARVAGWKTMWTTNGVNDTAIFVKPAAPGEASRVDVTVIVPTFHRERTVVEAVESALRQTGVTVEVLVIDDSEEGSARSAIEGLRDARVRYQKRAVPSRGRPVLVRNDGIAGARGRFLLFLDDDDQLTEGALAALADALERSPRAGVALGTVIPFGDEEASVRHERAYFDRAARRLRARRTRFDMVACLLFKDAPLVNSACMIRRELARAIGGYDPRTEHCEDVELYSRAIRASGFAFVDRPVVHYRTDGTSRIHAMTGDRRRLRESYRAIHASYRAAHGHLEFGALKLLARAIR
jgi:glycosyltransferase involved in cell wall biosynthesis